MLHQHFRGLFGPNPPSRVPLGPAGPSMAPGAPVPSLMGAPPELPQAPQVPQTPQSRPAPQAPPRQRTVQVNPRDYSGMPPRWQPQFMPRQGGGGLAAILKALGGGA